MEMHRQLIPITVTGCISCAKKTENATQQQMDIATEKFVSLELAFRMSPVQQAVYQMPSEQ